MTLMPFNSLTLFGLWMTHFLSCTHVTFVLRIFQSTTLMHSLAKSPSCVSCSSGQEKQLGTEKGSVKE